MLPQAMWMSVRRWLASDKGKLVGRVLTEIMPGGMITTVFHESLCGPTPLRAASSQCSTINLPETPGISTRRALSAEQSV